MEEFNSLVENDIFQPVRLPSSGKVIRYRQIFKLKHKADDLVNRYKVKLVAKGYFQYFRVEFSLVFTLTAKWAALKAILALAAIEDLKLYNLDIFTTFLNSEMDCDMYI